ncbi:dolichyl-diphosphooligosaccharide--protein glycosyltransferase subunit 1A [Dioscorea cayenensis subsp. rotundata]|uniref:Dolichyl-diphosphooligosaccharide--protein glycosyltransferase subunit 1 n=1 Tax=Dioscorea cayennensis subsp. rotundata TaxID=55577 RepID=A0AB40C9H3_DIOCR|nr:dolichyl-diphosphooligosaccharide--protein glycosyltransferase subunit 1A [Dioscorea cayenensis subsp. rotundata]
MASMSLRFAFVLFWISILASTVLSDLVISKIDRRIDLTSQIVRVVSSLKVENRGHDTASEVLLAFPDIQAKNLAYLQSSHHEGKGKGKQSAVSLPVTLVQPEGMPSDLTFYSISLPKGLEKGKSFTLDVLAVFTHSLKPFPEEITQADVQLVVYQDSAYYISPYEVRFQTLAVRLPSGRVESYTKYPSTKLVESDIKYGPFENLPPFSYIPITVHFESSYPFAVVQELEREIEISHWGNIQVTEHYSLVHGGAPLKGGFSRIEFQSRPPIRGESSIRHFIAMLPPRAHSVYYRDEIGNISTSHLWSDSKMTYLQIEPRYPMFGGWRTSFTIGYGLPLRDFLYEADGKRFLNITFGCPFNEIVIDHLIVKVVLPEGSKEISAAVPFVTKQSQEVKYSHLDIVGRPVIVLEKTIVVPEHNIHFQVYYKFNNLALLMEPFLLISGFLFLFIACIVYMHTDASISKFSASYLAKQQLDEVRATVQQVLSIINRVLAVHNKLETSLRDLSRTGDVQSCKAARKAADGSFKDLAKELKPLLGYLQSSPQASQIWPKVEELLSKEKELQEKLMAKHSAIVDGFEKKSARREVENRVASIDQKLAILRQEADELLDTLDDF